MKHTRRRQRGQSTLEYVLVGTAILVAVMAVVGTQIGGKTGAVDHMMGNAAGAMQAASGSIVTGTGAQGTRGTRGTRGTK